MKEIKEYVGQVAHHFKAKLGASLADAYTLGSLAHGGYSTIYSDIDVGLLINCAEPPVEMATLIADAKTLDDVYGKKLSIFWGNPAFTWGRLPNLDRPRPPGSRRAASPRIQAAVSPSESARDS
jgi:hypothetical protein